MVESPDMLLYFLAYLTKLDCFDKRGKKGYAFIVGDENLPQNVKIDHIEKVFGYVCEDLVDNQSTTKVREIPIQTILDKVNERWELFYILPKMTSHYDDPRYYQTWVDRLGERVIRLEEPEGISELIAGLIGTMEDNVDLDDLSTDLTSEKVDLKIINSVSKAIAPLNKGTGLSKVSEDSGLAIL